MHGAINHLANEIDMDMKMMINVKLKCKKMKFQTFHTPSLGGEGIYVDYHLVVCANIGRHLWLD
jgi:hypothetical protein